MRVGAGSWRPLARVWYLSVMRRVGGRLILPTVGLVVAVAVGWPLGWLVFCAVLGCTWLPLVAWATLAAGRRDVDRVPLDLPQRLGAAVWVQPGCRPLHAT